jgi:diacylglycerol kinase (ATP)
MAPAALARLRQAGIEIEIVETHRAGEGSELAREAWRRGVRRFIAVGGDGTSFEILNGIFPAAIEQRAALGFLPLGTGNSFLRDFVSPGGDAASRAAEAIAAGSVRRCDVVRLRHRAGELYYINLLSMGFTADVAALVNRRFKPFGELGYLLGVLVCLARLRRRPFPLRAESDAQLDQRRCLFLSFSNSRFTGGKMMIAPQAGTADGLIEYVRWGPIGRAGLVWNLPSLYDGSHIRHRLAERRGVTRVEFELEGPVDVMVDGEVKTLECRSLEVLPAALDVLV